MQYRIRVKCECGSELACKPKSVGKEKRCPTCAKHFLVPLPCDAFWVVMPNLTLAEYQAHAEALCELSVAIRGTNLSDVRLQRDIRRSLYNIKVMCSDTPGQSEVLLASTVDSGIAKALSRLASGSTFGGCKSPDRRYG